MMEEIGEALDRAAARPWLKAVLLDADGPAFSNGVALADHAPDRVKQKLETVDALFRRLRAVECVTVAAVQGAAIGGGAELATCCDVVIAADDATLGQPEITMGMLPPIAAVHYPARIGLGHALRLILSGEVIAADEARAIGLVDRVVPAAALEAAVRAEIERYTAKSAVVLRLAKRAVKEACALGHDEALALLAELHQRELLMTEDAEEGLRAAVDGRPPIWKNR